MEDMKEQAKQVEGSHIVPIAAGVVVGLAAWNLIDGFIRYLFAPLIAAFIGDSAFQLNSFTINSSEFSYGAFLEGVFVAVAVILLLSLAFPALWDRIRRR